MLKEFIYSVQRQRNGAPDEEGNLELLSTDFHRFMERIITSALSHIIPGPCAHHTAITPGDRRRKPATALCLIRLSPTLLALDRRRRLVDMIASDIDNTLLPLGKKEACVARARCCHVLAFQTRVQIDRSRRTPNPQVSARVISAVTAVRK